MDKINVNGKDASPVYNYLKVWPRCCRRMSSAFSTSYVARPVVSSQLSHSHLCRYKVAKQDP